MDDSTDIPPREIIKSLMIRQMEKVPKSWFLDYLD